MLDHHCLLLRTCIGERNHPRFLLTALFHATALSLYLHRLLRLPLCQDACRTQLLPLYSLALASRVYFLVITGIAVALAIVHTFLALTASVSKEVFGGRATEDQAEPCDLPFSSGPFTDFNRFVSQDELCYRVRGRLWTPTIWQIPRLFDRERTSICDNPLNNKYYSCC